MKNISYYLFLLLLIGSPVFAEDDDSEDVSNCGEENILQSNGNENNIFYTEFQTLSLHELPIDILSLIFGYLQPEDLVSLLGAYVDSSPALAYSTERSPLDLNHPFNTIVQTLLHQHPLRGPGMTDLHVVAATGIEPLVRDLLENKFPQNIIDRDNDGNTALHLAAANSNSPVFAGATRR